ncbi:MAG: hypothetical protein HND47_12655 [Chloroflexi bacterium]|nr:hypothetical protein [Chloroflexota bacterium]
MNNIAKHAGANHVDVRLKAESDKLVLRISDDGAGFDTSAEFPWSSGNAHDARTRREGWWDVQYRKRAKCRDADSNHDSVVGALTITS